MTVSEWRPRLTAAAMQDLVQILRWTRRRFGPEQARTYRATILSTIRELERGPKHPAVRQHESIAPGLMTLHVARAGRRGSHLLVFRVSSDQHQQIEILRILHESMDLPRHLRGSDLADRVP